MELTTTILCDFAQVRDGLLFLSSGGITRLWREQLPAPMQVYLALIVELDSFEAESPHEVRVNAVDEDGGTVVEAALTFKAEPPPPGEPASVPIVLDLREARVERYGNHEVRVQLDGNPARTLSFAVQPPPQRGA